MQHIKTWYLIGMLSMVLACRNSNQTSHSESTHAGSCVYIPMLKTNNEEVDTIAHVFNIALGDFATNIRPYKRGLLAEEAATLFAGIDYYGPWTRDGAHNIHGFGGLFFPKAAKNTLLSIMQIDEEGKLSIGGQYWDAMIFTQAAWQYYLFHGDKAFLDTLYQACVHTMLHLEKNEYDDSVGLFRGASFFNDGIAAYPDRYTNTGKYEGGEWVSDITKWVKENPDKKAPKGFGLPMMCLSTNCIYVEAYRLLDVMEKELGKSTNHEWQRKRAALIAAINKHLWDDAKGTYRYFIDPYGGSDAQEGAGLAMAILYQVADEKQMARIFDNAHIEPHGIPCLYPNFKRYTNKSNTSYGRHAGVIWPQINGYWALAALAQGRDDIFKFEFKNLAALVFRDKMFREIYHPKTGLPYGGIQENNDTTWHEWLSTHRQLWGASAYLKMILYGIMGMEYQPDGLLIQPKMVLEFPNFRLLDFPYRRATLQIFVKGKGKRVVACTLDGKPLDKPWIPATLTGIHKIELQMAE